MNETLIIGAGPAGLATAGRLRRAGKDFTILERSDKIADSWQNHYHRLCLHTVKKFSELPFSSFPKAYPNYVPRADLVKYYEDYAENFSIKPDFNTEVTSVRKQDGYWEVNTKAGNKYEAANVVVCTGFNRKPHRPAFKGEEDFQGNILHSRDYRTGKKFAGQKVLVVGMGNTGAEIALDLLEQGAQAYISLRSAVNIVPRDFNGRSIQETAALLRPIPNFISDRLGRLVQNITIGNLEKYGIKRPAIRPAAQLREQGKTPVIDLGTVAEIKKGKIKVLPDIEHFKVNSLLFINGEEENFDTVILATGYRAAVEDFLENAENYFNHFHVPKQVVFEDNLFFVGFDAYANGLLNSIYRDSEIAVEKILS